MPNFAKLVVLDNIDVPLDKQHRIAELSEAPVEFPSSDPGRAVADADADAVIASWRTPVDAEFIDAHPNLRYIGLCASRYVDESKASIDLEAARARNIVVSTLGQYSDEATSEWVIAQMLNAAHHIGPLGWRGERHELFGKRLGLVGLGFMGQEVADRAKAFGMDVVYWSRNRKDVDFEYLSVEEVLSTSDVVSIHIGKGIQVFGPKEFAALRSEVMLINTSIGVVMDPAAFGEWLAKDDGVFIADASLHQELFDVAIEASNTLLNPELAASSEEMRHRKGDQLIENAQAFLADNPIRVQ